MAERAPRDRTQLAVFLAAALLCGAHVVRVYEPNKWLYADHSFYMNVTRGLAEHLSLDQGAIHPRSWYDPRWGWNQNLDDAWSNVSIGRTGTWYPKHPFLWPLVGAPFYLAFGVHGTLILNWLLSALIAALAYRIAARVAPAPAAAVAAVLIPASAFWQGQAYGYSNDIFFTALILAAVDQMLSARTRLAGLFWGLAVWAKMTNVLFAPAFALWLAWDAGFARQETLRRFARFALGAAPPIAILLLANWWMFGAPWITSYHRVLVVENGVVGVAAHTRLFTVPFKDGLARELWSGPASLREVFPLVVAAPLGLLALCRTATGRRLAAFVALAAVPQILMLATYTYHRPQFLDAILALAVPALAALLALIAPGEPARPPAIEPAPMPRLGRWAAVAAGVFALCAVGRAIARPGGERLYDRVEEAQVFLGETPCDYFNNQNERWECSHFDLGADWTMTGRTLGEPPRFKGAPRAMIWMHAHPSHRPRRMIWPALPLGKKLTLAYGLTDEAHRGPVHVTATLDGEMVLAETLAEPGDLRELVLDTTAKAGKLGRLEVAVTAEDASYKQFCFDGLLR